jgi:hypothetical protein
MDSKVLPTGAGAGTEPPAVDPARRGFLKAMPLGALVVAAGGIRAAEAAPAAAAAAEPQASQGYHETEHIRTYYRTAAFW